MKVDKASLMSECFNEASHTPHVAYAVLASRLDLSSAEMVEREALEGESGESGLVLSVTPAAHTPSVGASDLQVSPRQTREVTFSCQIPVTRQRGLFLICRFLVSHPHFFPHGSKQLNNI